RAGSGAARGAPGRLGLTSGLRRGLCRRAPSPESTMHAYRTHTCGPLRAGHVGEPVRLSGWAHRKRDHRHLLFIHLRDHYGLTQIVIDSARGQAFAAADAVRLESVITVTGKCVARSPETVNPKLATGEIEVAAESVTVISAAEQVPLQVNSDEDAGEEVRLR